MRYILFKMLHLGGSEIPQGNTMLNGHDAQVLSRLREQSAVALISDAGELSNCRVR